MKRIYILILSLVFASIAHGQVLRDVPNQEKIISADAIITQLERTSSAGFIIQLQPKNMGADQIMDIRLSQSEIRNIQTELLSDLSDVPVSDIVQYSSLPMMFVRGNEETLRKLAENSRVAKIYPDKLSSPLLTQSTEQIGATDVWLEGYTGVGKSIVILDTGVDINHEYFDGQIAAEACFSPGFSEDNSTSLCPSGNDSEFGSGSGQNCDTSISGCDHGTHVAGIAAGSNGSMQGVAPDADIIAIQVFSRFDDEDICGSGKTTCVLSYNSAQLSALDYIYTTLRHDYDIASINMSLGGEKHTSPCDDNPLTSVIENLKYVHIPTIAASGNNGFDDGIVGPACISDAISVGSVNNSDGVSGFSNAASFLDFLAPGSNITSTLVGDTYGDKSGTSMATPHVAGAWALMKEAHPNDTVDEIKSLLQNSATYVTDTRNNEIFPRIQLQRAIQQPIDFGNHVAENETEGWQNVIAEKIYVTNDDTYIHFRAEFDAAPWQSWGFLINTTSEGGSNDPYGHPINFSHNPDYVIRGGFFENTYDRQLVVWTGTEWDYKGEFAESEIQISPDFIEVRIPASEIGNPESIDVQFFITGDNSEEHGVFSAIPQDDVVASWDVSGDPSELSTYVTDISVSSTLPEEIVLAAPLTDETNINLLPTFEWEQDSEAETYEIQVAEDSAFENVIANISGIEVLEWTLEDPLFFESEYYWRVRGSKPGGNGPWSETRKFTTTEAQVSIAGNGNDGFGGLVGESTLLMADDGIDLFLEFRPGSGSFGNTDTEKDILVIYVDDGSAGRNSIDQDVDDTNDANRRAISSAGAFASELTFHPDFEASKAIATGVVFGGMWRIPNSGIIGDDDLDFILETGQPDNGSGNDFMMQIPLAEFESNDLKLTAILVNGENGFSSNEGYGRGMGSDNPGGDAISFSGYWTYPSGEEIARTTKSISGNAGWLMLSASVGNQSVSDLASQNLVQGISGLNDFYNDDQEYEQDIAPNLYFFNNTDDWQTPNNIDSPLESGFGFIWYLFDNDVDNSVSLPFNLVFDGPVARDDVTVTQNPEHHFTLLGNPFPEPLDVSDVSSWGNIQSNAQVWNPETESFEIASEVPPLGGFFVERSEGEGGGEIVIPTENLVLADQVDSKKMIAMRLYHHSNDEKILMDESARIIFHPEARHGWDIYDARILNPLTTEFAKLGFLGKRQNEIVQKVLESRPLDFESPIELSLTHYFQNISGEFEIDIALQEIPDHWEIILTDHIENKTINLREESYQFESDHISMTEDDSKMGTLEMLEGSERFTLSIQNQKTTSLLPDSEKPREIALHQNHPNPFNPVTQIQFSLPEAMHVTLEVFDLTGQKLMTLENNQMESGNHQVTFDGSSFSSGMYIYRLSTPQKTITRKMLLIK